MAGQLLPLEEAAKLLKVSPDALNEMRLRSDIPGVRTGSTWKFKMEEIERVADERGIALTPQAEEGEEPTADTEDASGGSIEFQAFDVEEETTEEGPSSSILVSEQELGKSQTPSSTVIGDDEPAGDSDLKLASNLGEAESPSDLRLATEESDLKLASGAQAQAQAKATDSDLRLAADDDAAAKPAAQGSDLDLAAPAETPRAAAAESDLSLAEETAASAGDVESTDSDLEKTGGSDLEVSSGDSDIDLGGEVMAGAGESDLLLAGAEDVGAGDTGKLEKKAKASDLEFAGDDLDLDVSASSSALDLGGDDDLVLDNESALEGDVALSGDSGINLTRPSDSGIDLAGADGSGISLAASESGFMLEDEDALELEGGSSVDSLELPEDVDVVSLDEDLADPDAATQLKSDEDFDLTPVEGAIEDESDSGSQVIALDTEELDADAPTQLGAAALGGDEAIITEEDDAGFAPAPAAAQPGLATAGQPQTQFPTQELPEAPYSVWQVGSLAVVALMIAFSGILMIDVVRNIWSFDQPYGASTSIMNSVIEALGI
ncbi:MAG: helix-turn-helix domain-containing protein [Planctomycetes bacterium]|nr:helix-turn-helix domain-containing protein [Planctomycetota bacterium]